MREKRKVYLDELRILACFFVLFNHRAGYTLYMHARTAGEAWSSLPLTMFTRMNVPVFLMISGALLLGRRESLREVLGRRAARILAVLVIFSLILYLAGTAADVRSAQDFFEKIFTGKIHASYWYLYCYLGFLLMLPFLRMTAEQLDGRLMLYLLVLHMVSAAFFKVFGCGWQLAYGRGIAPESHLTFALATERNLFYPLFGWYLAEKLPYKSLTGRKVLAACGAAAAGIVVSSALTVDQGIRTGTYTQDFVMLFDYVTAAAVFLVFRYFDGRRKGRGALIRFICAAAPLTFGMYLMDPLWRILFGAQFDEALAAVWPAIPSSVLWCLLSMALSGAVTFLLRKLPILNKIV